MGNTKIDKLKRTTMAPEMAMRSRTAVPGKNRSGGAGSPRRGKCASCGVTLQFTLPQTMSAYVVCFNCKAEMAIYNTEANLQHTDDNPLGLGLESYNSKPQQKLPDLMDPCRDLSKLKHLPDLSKVQFQNFAGPVPAPYQGIYETD